MRTRSIIWGTAIVLSVCGVSASQSGSPPSSETVMAQLIRQATCVTKNSVSERRAQRKLVEIGDEAVPAIVLWLKQRRAERPPSGVQNGYSMMVDVLSQIGSPEARAFIIAEYGHDARLLTPIEIWQSPDRFERLCETLKGSHPNCKWAIFKLGVLGDARAVGLLEAIAAEDKDLDIRETAKDAVAHLRDPNVPVRYVDHWPSYEMELTAAASYRVGEPVKIRCRITGGPYGGPSLVEFACPQWHFLPWGGEAQPFCLSVHRRRGQVYDKMHPIKQLRPRSLDKTSGAESETDGYVDVADLGSTSVFELQPGESRVYEFADIRPAFDITESGEYRFFVSRSDYVLSEFLTIRILPTTGNTTSPP
ncbi:MAG: hypothetical protein ABFE01_12795 [Phycisphaerales bacterium]